MGNAATVRRAAVVRAAVQAAVHDGTLGEMPAEIRVSVRSGVDMIYIEINGAPENWSAEAGPSDSFPFGRRIGSAEACELSAALVGIVREQVPGLTMRVLLIPPDGSSVTLGGTDG